MSNATERLAWVMRLKDGNEDIYKQKHDEIWPEMLANMQRGGIRTFSIYLHGLDLFAYMERDRRSGPEGTEPDEVTWRWWQMMSPFMETHPDSSPIQYPVREMFHFENPQAQE